MRINESPPPAELTTSPASGEAISLPVLQHPADQADEAFETLTQMAALGPHVVSPAARISVSPLEKLMGDLGAAAYEARSAYQFARGNGPLATWTPVTVDTEQGRLISVEENVVVPATGQPLPAGSREHVQGLAQAAQNEVAEAGERLNAGDMAGARVLADSAGKKSAQAVAAGVEEARKAGFHIPEADTATEADPDTGPPAGGKTLHRIASDLKEALLELGLFGLGGWAGFKSLSMAGAELGFETWLRVNFAAMSLIVVPPQPSTHDQI